MSLPTKLSPQLPWAGLSSFFFATSPLWQHASNKALLKCPLDLRSRYALITQGGGAQGPSQCQKHKHWTQCESFTPICEQWDLTKVVFTNGAHVTGHVCVRSNYFHGWTTLNIICLKRWISICWSKYSVFHISGKEASFPKTIPSHWKEVLW